MNEQDIINKIDESTKDLPIPDSISPDNMKQMLDEHIHEISNPNHINSTNTTEKHNRINRRLAAVACVALCLIGGAITLQNSSSKDSAMTDGAAYDMGNDAKESAEETVAESAMSESVEETDSAGGSSDEILVAQTDLQSPSSYEAYYETLKDAYDEYYDQIASVTTNDALIYEDGFRAPTEAAIAEGEEKSETEVDSVADLKGDTTSTSQNKLAAEDNISDAQLSSSKDHSTTNTQEKTVDEGDIIKTDGTYIYKLITSFNNNTGYYNRTLTITETDDGNLKALTSIDLTTLAKDDDDTYVNFYEFYLYEDYLALLYTKEDYTNVSSVVDTCIAIYDITDRENVKLVRTLTQSGWYESSRISEGYLYTISNFSETSLDTLKPYTNYIPSTNGATIDCKKIYYPRDILMKTTYVITSLDMTNPKDFTDTKAIPSNNGNVYVSNSSIYIYATLYKDVTKTEITKIDYKNGAITPGKSATITGYLYDSFALSEYNGYLRIVATIPANNVSLLRVMTDDIVTSSSSTSSSEDTEIPEDVNVLYILDNQMELTGKLSGIAPGEIIYSARFMGDIGYFVTFKNMDPLFSVDLSDPENPKILGALKIPGFSNYLHSYDNGLLLGFGEEIDPNTGEPLGLKLSMFDTGNPADVTEQDKYIIENAVYSDAQYNHKAMMIDTEKNIFGFTYEYIDETTYEGSQYYYATYTYDEKDGFIETARYLLHDNNDYYYDTVRGIYIGDYFYLATDYHITSYKIGSTEMIAQVTLK